uniref:Uncharacterized protein n=1 Tax=Arundo donax TaxID=35708 RepID=A0A0A9D518_ARUDO
MSTALSSGRRRSFYVLTIGLLLVT